jgi:hypothetical protein
MLVVWRRDLADGQIFPGDQISYSRDTARSFLYMDVFGISTKLVRPGTCQNRDKTIGSPSLREMSNEMRSIGGSYEHKGGKYSQCGSVRLRETPRRCSGVFVRP